jgi:hypothetical protein
MLLRHAWQHRKDAPTGTLKGLDQQACIPAVVDGRVRQDRVPIEEQWA